MATKPSKAAASADKNIEEKAEAKPKAAIAEKQTEASDNAKSATAKAGKRSKKAAEEQAAKDEKETRKRSTAKKTETTEAQKTPQPKLTPKNPAHAHGKRWRAAHSQIETGKQYELEEAVALVQKLAPTKFDASLELHVNLGIDVRQSDQIVRTHAALPAGTGKTVRVAVIADEKGSAAAKAAGAELTDAAKINAGIAKGKFDFDILITTPDQMPALAKQAKVLGPKGLMPSPKSGTVTTELAKTIREIKAGKAEIKTDSAGIVHLAFGRASFKTDDLIRNAKTVIAAIMQARPSTVKGTYVKAISMSTSMSPSVRVDVHQAIKTAKA